MELPKIPGYRYVRKIGEGGFCEVYLAEHQSSINLPKLAIKIPKDENYPIEYEAAVLEYLHNHNKEGIVPYYGLSTKSSPPSLILGYIRDTLEKRLKIVLGRYERWPNKDLSPYPMHHYDSLLSQDLEFFGLLAGRIKYALEGNYIVHEDLKPSNILIDRGMPIITDFGFYKFWNYNMFEPGTFGEAIAADLSKAYTSDFFYERLPKDKYNLNWQISNPEDKKGHREYLKVSMKKRTGEKESLLFSKSVLDSSRTIQGGTPFYQAPESLQGKVSGKEDVYSLGRIFEEILKLNKERVNGGIARELEKRGIKIEYTNKNEIIERTSYLDKKIQDIQTNYLHYDPNKRPFMIDIEDFANFTITKEKTFFRRIFGM
ncbi:MAG: protein kinase [bacterium]|nr:protein kinase [bacterium]